MKNSNQKASLKISQDVIETIAKVAALEIEGVADTVEQSGNLINMLKGPIEIKMMDGIAEISIGIILDFGANISDVCKAVQRNIKDNVQTMTGIIVSKVNVSVEGINLPKNNKDNAEKLTE